LAQIFCSVRGKYPDTTTGTQKLISPAAIAAPSPYR
jgi:hypothetical protein